MDVKGSGGITCSEGGSGDTVVASDVPTDYQLAPRSNATNDPAPLSLTPQPVPQGQQQPSHYGHLAPPGLMTSRRKRGRPRKYEVGSGTLSPFPISSSVVLERTAVASKTVMNQCNYKYEPVHIGARFSYSAGHNFTPHILIVHPGEDIMKKMISFPQEGGRAICILSAKGSVSNVTLRQPNSAGGTITYQGCFEIMSLSGSFIPCEGEGGRRNTSGGMSILLANSDTQLVGGGVAGLLIAATTIQMVVATFLLTDKKPQNPSNSNHMETTIYNHF